MKNNQNQALIFNHFIFLIICVFLFTGCMNVDTVVEVNPDGSGMIRLKLVTSRAVLALFKESGDRQTANQEQQFNPYNEAEFKKMAVKYGPGVQFKSFEAISDEKNIGGIGVYSFHDINKIKTNILPVDQLDNSDGKQVITFQLRDEMKKKQLLIHIPQEKQGKNEQSGNKQAANDYEQIKLMKDLLKEMHLSLRVIINGEVLESDAPFINGSEITLFDIDFDFLFQAENVMKDFIQSNYQSEKIKKLNGQKGFTFVDLEKINVLFE